MKELFEQITQTKNNENNPAVNEIRDRHKTVYIYGAGAVGHEVYSFLKQQSIDVSGFISGLKYGYKDETTGIQVVNVEGIGKKGEAIVIIAIGDTASETEKTEIKNHLVSQGISAEDVFEKYWFEQKVKKEWVLDNFDQLSRAYDILDDDESKRVFKHRLLYMFEYREVDFMSENEMYFDSDIISENSNEVIIDGGGYTGDTVKEFLRHFNDSIVVSFEPDEFNYSALKQVANNCENVTAENYGLWDKCGKISFSNENNGSAHVISDGEDAEGVKFIRTISIDGYCKEKSLKPTFIKMDIEGAEFKALYGCKETLKRCKPKLAICIYHKPEDIYELPLLVKELNEEYSIYIRHYSKCRTDTVMYCL